MRLVECGLKELIEASEEPKGPLLADVHKKKQCGEEGDSVLALLADRPPTTEASPSLLQMAFVICCRCRLSVGLPTVCG
jgi:hypothetical protein